MKPSAHPPDASVLPDRPAGRPDSGKGLPAPVCEVATRTLAPDAPRPDLSVVLINWRMGADLAGLVPSLRQHLVSVSCEILVVNKPSGDGTEELCAENPWIRLIPHAKFGISEMRNVGIRAARGRYCLMLDADTEIFPGCFDALVRFMDTYPRVGACGGHTTRLDGSLERNVKRFYTLPTILVRRTPLAVLWPDNPWNRHHLMMDRDPAHPYYGDWVAGACFCMRREAIEEVGLFDDRYYFGFEDTDWCWRAKRLGWKIAFNPAARIVHKVQRKSAKGFNRLTVEHLLSGARFWWKRLRLTWGAPDTTVRLPVPAPERRSTGP